MSAVARLKEQSTSTYCAIIGGNGEMILGLLEEDIHQEITVEYVSSTHTYLYLARPGLVFQ